MRTAAGRVMTEDDFRDALDAAMRGIILSDTGAGADLSEALLAVAESDEPIPDALIEAASVAYQRQSQDAG